MWTGCGLVGLFTRNPGLTRLLKRKKLGKLVQIDTGTESSPL